MQITILSYRSLHFYNAHVECRTFKIVSDHEEEEEEEEEEEGKKSLKFFNFVASGSFKGESL